MKQRFSPLKWILLHKRIVFLYVPLVLILFVSCYTGLIYCYWQADREMAFDRLSRYKELIDRTEELKKGYVYQYSDVDVSAKVVDIPTRIYDRNDEIIGEFFEQKREIVPYDNIPEWIIKGVIASEDRNFHQHRGISYRGIARAFIVNLLHLSIVQGGSTITQQLAKVLFTDMERSIKRKIYESFCAVEIEKRYDKQDILSMYLNLIYFGNGAYGVESASRMFFGLPVRELNVVESAMIVATISSPKVYSPLSNLDKSILKTRRILRSLVDAGYITGERSDYIYSRFLKKWDVRKDNEDGRTTSLIGSFVFSSYRVNRAPFFNERIRRTMVERFGEDAVKKGGLNVYTTIDAHKQDVALEALRRGIAGQRGYHLKRAKRIRNRSRSELELAKSENIEGALLSLDPFTGQIIAYAGGSEFTSGNQLDNVYQISRQPGSSFKPLVYASAIESRDITPSTVFIDSKTTFRGGYAPRNYDNTYSGKIIVREALRKSVNVVAVKVLEKTGYDGVFSILRKSLNISGNELSRRFSPTLSLALGTYEVSPLENAVLHSVIVNGGDYVSPYGIRYVKDYNGNVVWNNEEERQLSIKEMRKKTGKIIDPRACAVVISILKGVFEEGGTACYCVRNRKISSEIAGKTGTTSDFNDAWFVGYTPELVTAVWIGNRKGAISLGRGRSGGIVAGPVWADYVSGIDEGSIRKKFTLPSEGISRENICLDSGMVAGRNNECPRVARGQVYYSGTEPGEYCTLHRQDMVKNENKDIEKENTKGN